MGEIKIGDKFIFEIGDVVKIGDLVLYRIKDVNQLFNECEIARLEKVPTVVSLQDAYLMGMKDGLSGSLPMDKDTYSAGEYQECTCKVENSPVDTRGTTQWMNIPEASSIDCKGGIREEIGSIWECLNLLESRIKKLEQKVYG